MNKRFRAHATAAALLLLPVLAVAQADMFGQQDDFSDPWDNLKLNSKVKVKLDFRNANIDNVVAYIERVANVTIVKDPGLTGPITVTTSSAVSLAEAFYVLDSTLRLRGFQIGRQRKILVIKASPKPPTRTGPGVSGPTGFADRQGTTTVEFYPLIYASASQVARAINDVFQSGTTISIGRPPGGGGPGGAPGGGPGGFQMSSGSAGNVKASYEEFSNSVIVNAPASRQAQVTALIKKIDQPQTSALHSKTFKLKYAGASDLATEVQSVLTANAFSGRGTQNSTPATQPGRSGFGRFPQATSTNNQSMAVADARANAIVVTGTDDQLKLAERVIADLDEKIPTATTTFVFQLENARSDTVANLLTAAFGQRSGASSSARTSSVTPSNNTFNNTSSSSSAGRSTGGLGADAGGDPNALALQDPNATSGSLLTSVGVTQGFGGQRVTSGSGSGSGSSANVNGQTTGHAQSGDIARVHDLTNQVTAISDPNTNSVIIVTAPDNVDLVKSVIDQLDRIPEQVMIQTVIVEATLDKSDQLGVEWNLAQRKLFGNTGGSGSQSFGLQSASPALLRVQRDAVERRFIDLLQHADHRFPLPGALDPTDLYL